MFVSAGFEIYLGLYDMIERFFISLGFSPGFFGILTPVYVTMPGWKTDMTAFKSEDEFPRQFKDYIEPGLLRNSVRHRAGKLLQSQICVEGVLL